jgi:hypothetical protein
MGGGRGVDDEGAGGARASEVGLLNLGHLGGTSLNTGLRMPPTLRIMDHFPVRATILTHRLPMRQRPTVGKKIERVRRTGGKVNGIVLLRVGELPQHILQIILDYQMMAMRIADDADHLQPARRRTGMDVRTVWSLMILSTLSVT